MGVCQWPEIGSKVAKEWFWGAKVREHGSKPTVLPTLDPFRDIDKTPLFRGE